MHSWLAKMRPLKGLTKLSNAQVDVNLRWAHMSEGTFDDVAALLIDCFLTNFGYSLSPLALTYIVKRRLLGDLWYHDIVLDMGSSSH